MTPALRAAIIAVGFVAIWQFVCLISNAPAYILPPPIDVAAAIALRSDELLHHALVTLIEIILGLMLGVTTGLAIAHAMMTWPMSRIWLMPLSIASQALPVFALAPILALWLGYGLESKVAMAALVVFFPVTAAAFDGLRQTPKEALDVVHAMAMNDKRALARILWKVRWPFALPVLAPGLKTAAAISPIGAVIGEWVGASEGLGHAMLKANSRAEIDMMFACAVVLMTMGIGLYALVDWSLRRMAPWASPKMGVETE